MGGHGENGQNEPRAVRASRFQSHSPSSTYSLREPGVLLSMEDGCVERDKRRQGKMWSREKAFHHGLFTISDDKCDDDNPIKTRQL